MLAFRLNKRAYTATALHREGARLWGGRWNPPGHPLVYTSESLSLAVLETLVHADPSELPDDLMAVAIEIPDDLPMPTMKDPPRNWRNLPAPRETQQRGLEWLESRTTAVLRVPSVILPTEFNLLINPRHPDARRIGIASQTRFTWDARRVR